MVENLNHELNLLSTKQRVFFVIRGFCTMLFIWNIADYIYFHISCSAIHMFYSWLLDSVGDNKQGKSEGFDSCDRPSTLIWNWIQIINFWAHVTWKFDGIPKKTIGHLLYIMPIFVHHFKAIGEFKMELQSGNAKFGSKSEIFCPLWPWKIWRMT